MNIQSIYRKLKELFGLEKPKRHKRKTVAKRAVRSKISVSTYKRMSQQSNVARDNTIYWQDL